MSIRKPGTFGQVRQDSRRLTVIEVSFDPHDIIQADEYIVTVNGVRVARWNAGARSAIRAGIAISNPLYTD
jgi:hypothetical protein